MPGSEKLNNFTVYISSVNSSNVKPEYVLGSLDIANTIKKFEGIFQWKFFLNISDCRAFSLSETVTGSRIKTITEGLLQGVVHSVNRHILFLRNRKLLSFSSNNRHRPTGRTIILITDLFITARSKFFAIC